jgi:hypothetical protein
MNPVRNRSHPERDAYSPHCPILTLSSYLRVGLPSALFRLRFKTIPYTSYTLSLRQLIISHKECKLWSSCIFLQPLLLLLLPRVSLSISFEPRSTPSFTPIRNKLKFNLHIFRQHTERSTSHNRRIYTSTYFEGWPRRNSK